MSSTERLPVLPLDDRSCCPAWGSPGPLRRRGARRGRRRRTAERRPRRRVLLVPRLDGRYAGVGTSPSSSRSAGCPAASPAAVVRGAAAGPDRRRHHRPRRARCGSRRRPVDEPAPTERARRRAGPASTRPWSPSILQQRGAWQVVDARAADRPTRRRSPTPPATRRTSTAEQKLELLETADVGRAAGAGWSAGRASTSPSWTSPRRSARTSRRAWRSSSASSCCASSWPPSARSWRELDGEPAATEERRLPGPRRGRRPAGEGPRGRAASEVDKLERTSDQSPEGGWIRTWLDTVLEMPWNDRDRGRLRHRRRPGGPRRRPRRPGRREGPHHRVPGRAQAPRATRGLGVVGGRRSGAVLALVGPPGVGKTSLGESVARAMGRKFVRVALGGVRDEAEIRGHRRTYVGALPGRIVRAIQRGRLDEPGRPARRGRQGRRRLPRRPDGGAARGARPGAEPHLPRPLPRGRARPVRRACSWPRPTCWRPSPAPLLDRMELVRLDGYTEDEKVAIARDHLLPRQLERAGPDRRRGRRSTDDALRRLAAEYTREAGVRDAGARRSPGCCARSRRGSRWATASCRSRSAADDLRGYLGPPAVHRRSPAERDRGARRGDRPGGDRRRRRRAVHRGVAGRPGDRRDRR